MDPGDEKSRTVARIRSLDNVIKGSVYEMKRFCGKESCSCAKRKRPHKSLFLSSSYKGKTRLVPIKKDQVAEIKRHIKDYRELKAAIDELALINAELLRGKD